MVTFSKVAGCRSRAEVTKYDRRAWLTKAKTKYASSIPIHSLCDAIPSANRIGEFISAVYINDPSDGDYFASAGAMRIL